jgi:hypothetical protein
MVPFLRRLASAFDRQRICNDNWLTDQIPQHNIRRTIQNFPKKRTSWIEVTGYVRHPLRFRVQFASDYAPLKQSMRQYVNNHATGTIGGYEIYVIDGVRNAAWTRIFSEIPYRSLNDPGLVDRITKLVKAYCAEFSGGLPVAQR